MLRFLRQQMPRWLVALTISECALLMLGVHVSMYLRYIRVPAEYAAFSQGLLLRSAIFALCVMTGMAALGLYQPHVRETPSGVLLRQAVGFAIGGVLLVLLYYAIPQIYIGRGVIGLSLFFGLLLVCAFRVWFLSLIDSEMLKRRVAVLGAGQAATAVHRWLSDPSNRRTLNLVGYIPVGNDAVCVPQNQLISISGSLFQWALQHDIAEIVVGPDDRRGVLSMEQLLECKHNGIEVTDVCRFLERESGEINLAVSPSWLVFSEGFHATLLRKATKRAFDIVSAMAVLLLTWPFMLLVALAIRLESGPGQPILYRQRRVGEHGFTFNLYKFRSMRTDAERDGIARWAATNDDRVTRVGRFIRKVRLDELPQLWNVLCGEMSFIGPRPERPEFVDGLNNKITYYSLRHAVKPGLTGWAQLRYPYGSSEEDASMKLTYDLFYVKNHSMRFDLMIFIQTIEVVLFGRGAR
ncbi:MAG: TIGR03013 family PEP-CTERM/XrtA system glycosyltransferase [Proteobacteria bacterium]|uniref:TIGR03013 family XrtA/PEP-CTERM system glycosyltransferase n=1 Tax=Rudaea sp. TaxID=2136325 RepID=UPI0032209305|nr:TIGR03013 family PEP-CTERM/XrtA system glycosyltransferase [Pseudomonadota bacterium]